MIADQTHRQALGDILNILKKHKFSIFLTVFSLTALIGYSHLTFEIESSIYNLNKQKSLLMAENFQLKRYISELSNPERINAKAKQELGMVDVKYRQVKFIDVK